MLANVILCVISDERCAAALSACERGLTLTQQLPTQHE